MKINRYFAFQTKAIEMLEKAAIDAQQFYSLTKKPQVVSFTAPTGAGKTIMMATVMEDIFIGTDKIPENPDAIFVWLSDSPQLNEQSRDKIELKSDKIRFSQLVTITEDSFDRETLEEGHVYFLNTQKLGSKSKLCIRSDSRQYTIWETLANTANEKANNLYIIIDEAHRGMKDRKAAEATTIMQKFIKGSPKDGLPPMPVVLGMSATSERFNQLVMGSGSTIQQVVVKPEDVRSSGLLKDKIIFTYPESSATSDMAVLEAAADEWKNKCDHWKLFCDRYNHYKVNPVMLIQVGNGSQDVLSETDLDACVMKIEQRTNQTFNKGEIVHTFGESVGMVLMNNLEVPYVEPSKIADDRTIRVVFFKENLSTGWDCPRAETMMSFRHATDATYIAQLVGRMVRTPIGQRVQSDESLNNVIIYLPYFDRDIVKNIVNELQSQEGGALPTDFVEDSLDNPQYGVYGTNSNIRMRVATGSLIDNKLEPSFPDFFTYPEPQEESDYTQEDLTTIFKEKQTAANTVTVNVPKKEPGKTPEQVTIKFDYEDIPRKKIIHKINSLGLTTFNFRDVQINNYLKSLFAVTRFLYETDLDKDLHNTVKAEIVALIHNYAEQLRQSGQFEKYKSDVLSFKLHSQVFDVFGNEFVEGRAYDMYSASNFNLDIQFRQAESKLGGEGIGKAYGRKYLDIDNQENFKIDVILYSLNDGCIEGLNKYAKGRFHEINDTYRMATTTLDEQEQKRYSDIIKDGNKISEVNYILPETVGINKTETSEKGDDYSDHLYVDEKTGKARISLNSWEKDVIHEEECRSDFVCWRRNPVGGRNSLCLKYLHNGVESKFYPDFLIVRKHATFDYVVDILEPHNPSFDDNVGKAKALAEYAKKHYTKLGRVQLIRGTKIPGQYQRLDMCKSEIADEVLKLNTAEELNHLFDLQRPFLPIGANSNYEAVAPVENKTEIHVYGSANFSSTGEMHIDKVIKNNGTINNG